MDSTSTSGQRSFGPFTSNIGPTVTPFKKDLYIPKKRNPISLWEIGPLPMKETDASISMQIAKSYHAILNFFNRVFFLFF